MTAPMTVTRPSTIGLRDVGVSFHTDRGVVTALDGVTASLPECGFTSLLGPSGCGKSTLLRVIADLLDPSAGAVDVLGETPHQRRLGRDIGFVFQDAALLPWRTAVENVRLPLEVGGGVPKGRQAGSAEELLALVGLGGREHAYPHELSGGMRQRVAIARALICQPKVLLMDEPFGALDEITRDRLNVELLRIWQETGTTVVFVTHSIPEAVFLSQQVVVMSAHPGRIREVVAIDLPYPRGSDTRDNPHFSTLASRLRHLLEQS
jgi:NitT/TauT family transport system ATP-binding protein